MRKPRHLSAEDRAIWEQVARRVEPLHPAKSDFTPDQVIQDSKARKPDPTAIPPFKVGAKADPKRKDDVLPGLGQALRQAPVQMDSKAFGKMSRGKLKPEARIDLHGMTLDEAYPALMQFIYNTHADGRRLVLVITGKGNMQAQPGQRGVLRRYVPQWLRTAPLAGKILEIRPAHLRHGGDGAFYVYLRRARQTG